MEKAVLLILVSGSLFCIADGLISISTPDQNLYRPLEPDGISIQSVTSIRFSVKATNDVHVGFYQGASASPVPSAMYEIVIGGWGNGKSVLRKSQQGGTEVSASHAPLSQTEYRPFWVSWENGITVGSGTVVGSNQFLYLNDTTYSVAYMAIFTGYGSTGEWRFDEHTILSSSSTILADTTSFLADTTTNFAETTFLQDTNSSSLNDVILSTSFEYTLKTESASTALYARTIFTLSDSVGPKSTYITEMTSFVDFTNNFQSSILGSGNSNSIFNASEIVSTSLVPGDTESPGSISESILNTSVENSELQAFSTSLSTSVMEATTMGSGVTSTSTSIPYPSTTPRSSERRLCGCRCLFRNLSNAEIVKNVHEIVKRLSVPKTNLSSTRRKRSSAQDERPSSRGLGSGAVFLAVIPLVLIVLADVQKIYVLICRK